MRRSAFSAASPARCSASSPSRWPARSSSPGIVAVTLSPMMCSLLLRREMTQGRFARLIDRIFSRLAEAYGRRLERSLDYRPVTALFAAAIFVALGFMYLNTSKELAPEEDQGVLFALTKAPQYANLDYLQMPMATSSTRRSPRSRRPICALSSTAGSARTRASPASILKPWGERTRSAAADQAGTAAEGQRGRGHAGLRLLAAAAAGLDRRPAGADGDDLDRRDFVPIYERWRRSRTAARKSGLFMVIDSDLAFNQPTIQVDDRPQQGQRARRHDAGDRRYAGAAGRRELRQPLQSRRPLLSGDPAGAADRPADPGDADAAITSHSAVRPAGAAVQSGDGQDDDRAECADPLQPAQLGDLPGRADAGRDDGPGGRFPRTADGQRCRPGSATTTCRTRGNTCARATSWSSPSSSR